MRLLLIEDDDRIVQFLTRGLSAEGHEVEVANDGAEGLAQARAGRWDAILLDLMLPRLDGRDLCRILRTERCETPIMMLTALDATEDVVKGLRLGADEYLAKPFAFEELLVRLEKMTQRRLTPEPADILKVDDLEFDRAALILRRGEERIELTSQEYALLEFFMLEAGKVVTRAQILERVWGASEDALTNVVDVYVRRLRAKIEAGRQRSLIKTVRGRGYRFAALDGPGGESFE